MTDDLSHLPLGKTTTYAGSYDPGLLCPVPRSLKREEIGLAGELPFDGYDIWNAYELSWLNGRGKPEVAIGEFHVPCASPNLIESKSFKLYLNSFNLTRISSREQLCRHLVNDLSAAAGAPVTVILHPYQLWSDQQIMSLPGECIDDLDIAIDSYRLDPELLAGAADPQSPVTETVYSHLLKSNCLVTGQPDWGSLLIRYRGGRIDREALLRYIVSFREHNEFHEQCVERIFVDLLRFCRPEELTVYARYTRRGGLDINPFRSNFEKRIENLRQQRQ